MSSNHYKFQRFYVPMITIVAPLILGLIFAMNKDQGIKYIGIMLICFALVVFLLQVKIILFLKKPTISPKGIKLNKKQYLWEEIKDIKMPWFRWYIVLHIIRDDVRYKEIIPSPYSLKDIAEDSNTDYFEFSTIYYKKLRELWLKGRGDKT